MHTEFLGDGILAAVIGILLVFGVLLIIAAILSVFSLFSKIAENKKNVKTDIIIEDKTEPVINNVNSNISENSKKEDELELIAVVSAAIAASMGTTTDKLVVRSLKKVSSWTEKSIYENQSNSQFF